MAKLTLQEGQDLAFKMFNLWEFREHAFEDVEEWMDNYMCDCFPTVFKEAVAWTGGFSQGERIKFSNVDAIKRVHEEYLKEYDRDDELQFISGLQDFPIYMLEEIHKVVIPFIDIELEIPEIEIFERTIQVPEYVVMCHNCELSTTFSSRDSPPIKCSSCKTVLNIKGK